MDKAQYIQQALFDLSCNEDYLLTINAQVNGAWIDLRTPSGIWLAAGAEEMTVPDAMYELAEQINDLLANSGVDRSGS